MHKFFSIINKVLTILVVITMTGQSIVQAQPSHQDGKPRIDYSDSTGKVVFIGADANAPLVVRAAKAPGLTRSESALAMVAQYQTDFGLRDAQSELQLLSENQVGNRNVTRFQQVYKGIPVIAGELVVNATESAGLLSLSGEIAPDLDINPKPTITAQQAAEAAAELLQKNYELTASEFTFSTPELWIYDSRLLEPDGTAPALVWRIEAQSNKNLPINEFILIDATRGHVALNFNQVDTAWSEAGAGIVKNEDTPQTATLTPTPIVPTSTPEAPQTPASDASTSQTDIQPTATLPAEKPETDQSDKSAPQPQAGVTYYVDIATGNNSNSCTAPASPCKDIQETINKAGTGDIIRITSGVYTKSTNPTPNVVINNAKNLTLSGGWDSGFTSQSGVSTIDGGNVNNGYLHTGGTVTIENFIIQNSTSADSGAIYMVSGTLTIKRSTLKNNSANRGSGIFMAGSGTLTVENSTISGNTATTSGAGMYLANGTGAVVTIKNSTISNNTTTGGSGGGITQANSASITLTNSIIANNTATSNPDCNGTLSNASYNIIENASGCTITSSSNNSNVDPLLSASLSGTFQVHIPQVGSPAINGGTNTGCPAVDQLGNLRPVGICDIGAVETGIATITVLSGNNQNTLIGNGFSAPLSVTVKNAENQPVSGADVTFTAPNIGSSANFNSTGTNTTIATTDSNGVATTSALTANTSAGNYTVSASASGYTSANFQLTNTTNATPSIIRYDDLVVDEARSRLYGADKAGNKVDVISMIDLSVISSYSLVNGAAPISLDISPDGSELAVAQSGIGFVKFINLTNGVVTETPSALSGVGTKVTDVIYGRTGILYALTNKGLHLINLTVTPHSEDVSQYIAGPGSYDERYGAISSDKNTLYYVTGTCCSGYNGLYKYDVSAGLTKPLLIKQTHLFDTGYKKGIRVSLIDDNSLLITSGSVYNTSDLTPKAKNFQSLKPATNLSGKNFYVTLYDETTITPDTLFFFDKLSSYKISTLSTGIIGTPGAIAATSDGGTLFISSTGGMAKISIGNTPPGAAIALPSTMHLYNDMVIDLPRNVVYATDPSGRIDVINLSTTAIVDSYLLPSGANPKGIDLSPNGNELAIALNGLEKILFIDPETGEKIADVTPQLDDSIYYQNQPFDLIYGKTNRLYASGNPGSSGVDYIHVINTATHSWVEKSPYPNTVRTSTEFSINQNKTYLYANQTFSPNNIYIYDIQTDIVTKLYEGPHGSVSANKFTIIPDGSKVFTSNGQVWDSILQSQLGTLQGAPGELIEYIPNLNLIALSAPGQGSDVIKIISPVNYSLLSTITPSVLGEINEMEVSSDGSKLVLNVNNQIVVINLNISAPASINVESGSNQTAALQSQFQQPLKVRVSNFLGNSLSGVTVTFTAPASGPSGVFGSTNSATAITDVNGIATSPAFTANNIFGSYQVYASISGVGASAAFVLLNGSLNVSTYTLTQTVGPLPGQLLCDESNPNCTNGVNLDADAAHRFAIDTYMYYLDKHGRQSINNANMDIISSVDYGSGYQNAYWSGTQMVYGDGYSLADDVVAHELTHGVTQYESNLFYYYQSGAINESFSDVWGELFDQENGLGNDSPSVKWLMGEELPIGAIRSMSNPLAYGDPDKMTSPYYNTTSSDNGGVHTNSGINNKAVYLMVDGGTFNGKTVTALGANKTLAIYYEVQTNLLSSGADYGDLYNLLYQACLNLVNGPDGITSANCQEVRDATDAVEMNLQPIANFNTDAPLCAPSQYVVPVYQDGFENGLGSWTINNGSIPRWQLDSPYGPFAHSGSHFLYGNDYPQSGTVTDATVRLASKLIPAGAYLHFAHAYDFEFYGSNNYDGGVLEYSTNGGSSWVDAGSLIDHNGYKGSIYSAYNNPLKGRPAFVGTSHGYISTRVNLASLAGQNVSFRWRMGLDDFIYSLGWAVDDVQIYTCNNGPTISGSTGVSGVVLSYTDGTTKSVTSDANGNYTLNVPNGWSGTITPSHACYTFSPASYSYTNVTAAQPNQNYTATFVTANGCAVIGASIGGANQGTYTLSPDTSQVLKYAVDGGPVVIGSGGGPDIIASLNQWRRRPSTTVGWTGVSQSMGLPVSLITDTYYFPRYDDSAPSSLYNAMLLANVDTVSRDITVTIGGVVRGTYTLAPSASQFVSYPGVVGGPVVVSSDPGARIVASLYELIRDPSAAGWNGQSEMMGLPASQLSDEYLIPIYFGAANPNTLNASLYIANVDSIATTVDVSIAGVSRGTYNLDPASSVVVKYALDGGPVVISSNNGANIVASLNQWRRRPSTTVGWTGVSQSMALPVALITNEYVIPRYDDSAPSSLYNALLLANVDTVSRDITVTIGGVVRGTYTLAPSASQFVSYPGVVGGPVVVSSDPGARIVASLYELIRDPSAVGWNGQSEMMGLPLSQLSDQYLIPLYFGAANPNTLNASIHIAVP